MPERDFQNDQPVVKTETGTFIWDYRGSWICVAGQNPSICSGNGIGYGLAIAADNQITSLAIKQGWPKNRFLSAKQLEKKKKEVAAAKRLEAKEFRKKFPKKKTRAGVKLFILE